MKIGFICHDAFPIKEPFQGGLEMITALIVQELVERGHDVVSLCLQGSELPGKMVYYEKDLSSGSSNSELENIISVSKSLNEFLLRDFDVVQNHSMHFQAILMGNICPQPFVTTFHTPVFSFINVGLEAISKKINQTFIGVSDFTSKLYEKSLPEVTTIYNGIDLSNWQYNFSNTKNYYSWSGRICKEKGLDKLLQLCVQEKINLKIAGPISEPSYFKEKIEPLLSLEIFEYVGHLKQKELNKLIGTSKAFIFSSVWDEPFGLVIAEALASGVPVIANNLGAAPEIINEKSGCLFNLDDPETFKHALKKVNSVNRRNCRKRAEEFCDHKIMVDKYEALYKSFNKNYLKKVI
ncbi:Glycosyltransferase involved in cell wall bisynthesis [Salegentibacter echinorum]|uniref:Glycosyltransferase involved in cell wall bisynthesis n=1 Tax=Salegentibacter echinorum TaxID=1073325 RepID=A0A1M5KCW5_SALEC|nr:glycosyltransferase [Salegentibacter echinorum]SHG50587.1 Glycosyltransferase involved in cell wall bisynthesis [Salegentibacter echinorum]